jgi:hypothetical protein
MVRQGRQQNICNLILIQTFETVTEFSWILAYVL